MKNRKNSRRSRPERETPVHRSLFNNLAVSHSQSPDELRRQIGGSNRPSAWQLGMQALHNQDYQQAYTDFSIAANYGGSGGFNLQAVDMANGCEAILSAKASSDLSDKANDYGQAVQLFINGGDKTDADYEFGIAETHYKSAISGLLSQSQYVEAEREYNSLGSAAFSVGQNYSQDYGLARACGELSIAAGVYNEYEHAMKEYPRDPSIALGFLLDAATDEALAAQEFQSGGDTNRATSFYLQAATYSLTAAGEFSLGQQQAQSFDQAAKYYQLAGDNADSTASYKNALNDWAKLASTDTGLTAAQDTFNEAMDMQNLGETSQSGAAFEAAAKLFSASGDSSGAESAYKQAGNAFYAYAQTLGQGDSQGDWSSEAGSAYLQAHDYADAYTAYNNAVSNLNYGNNNGEYPTQTEFNTAY